MTQETTAPGNSSRLPRQSRGSKSPRGRGWCRLCPSVAVCTCWGTERAQSLCETGPPPASLGAAVLGHQLQRPALVEARQRQQPRGRVGACRQPSLRFHQEVLHAVLVEIGNRIELKADTPAVPLDQHGRVAFACDPGDRLKGPPGEPLLLRRCDLRASSLDTTRARAGGRTSMIVSSKCTPTSYVRWAGAAWLRTRKAWQSAPRTSCGGNGVDANACRVRAK